jgi:uncharacterized protein (DUF952 family)
VRIFHLATASDWEVAVRTGSYTTSTRGVTLAEEGFIHASRGDQWQGVRERYYADVDEPLLLLVIDPALLTSPVVEEEVPGGETFPHVYGPIDVAAVVRTIALDEQPAPATVAPAPAPPAPAPAAAGGPDASPASFSRLYLQEMFRNVLVASVVLACVVVAVLVGQQVEEEWGPITGAAVGLAIGLVVVRRPWRRATSR